jgi:NAD-dependent DNA ligase
MKDFLDRAAKAYYDGNPIISDEEFDALSAAYQYEDVGASDGEVPHLYQMYSLQKVFEGEDSPIIFSEHDLVVTPKLDGAAVALVYENGRFIRGLTRGNGKKGRVITNLLRHLVPARISRSGLVQVTGEVVAPKEIPNARNYASGALNLKSEEEFLTRDLTFIAYDVFPKTDTHWSEEMYSLKEFNTVISSDWSQFPDDGKVFRIDSNAEFEMAGYTAHHPRGAFALKRKAPGVVTKLLNVIWNVGKSGVISPVAILEPVKIGEATVSKATLHNIRFIEDMNLEIGCMVEVIRSGEIIPKIVRRVS